MIRFSVALTMACQAKCPYCFEKDSLSNKTMSIEVVECVCRYIRNSLVSSKAKRIHITFYGGEPLLNIDALIYIGKNIKEYCLDNKIKFTSSIMTNGILLSKSIAKTFFDEINMVRAQITLDGTDKVHNKIKGIDCFDSVIKNIVESSEYFKIYIRLNISKDNISDINDLLPILNEYFENSLNVKVYLARVRDDLKVKSAKANSLNLFDFNEYVKNIYNNKWKFLDNQPYPPVARAHCSFEGIYNFCIDPDGFLYKCEHDVGNITYAVGDVNQGEYYNSREMFFYQNYDKECLDKRCAYLPICSGGCMMERSKKIVGSCRDIEANINNNIVNFYKERRKKYGND